MRKLFAFVITASMAAGLAACSSNSDRHAAGLPSGQSETRRNLPGGWPDGAPDTAALPGLTQLAGGPRSSSAVLSRAGDEADSSSSNVVLSAGTASFSPAAGELAWAVYSFATSAPPPQLSSLDTAVSGSDSYWLALSNFSTMRWDIYGPFSADASVNLSGMADSFSSGTQSFVAVLAHDGAAPVLEQVSISVPTPTPPDWVHTYGQEIEGLNTEVDENLHDIAVDTSGNVYALTDRRRSNESKDFSMLLVKYMADGTIAFARQINMGNLIDPLGIVVDSGGNSYLAARIFDFELLKLDADGALLWAKSYEVPGSIGPPRLDIDSADNLLLSFSSTIFGEESDQGCVVKLDSDGDFVWGRRWPHAFAFDDVQLAASGTDVFVLDDNDDFGMFKYPMIIRFDGDGNIEGTKVMTYDTGGTTLSAFIFETLTADPAGVMVGGTAQRRVGEDFVMVHEVLRFNPDLSLAASFSGAADLPEDLALDVLSMQRSSLGELFMLGVTQEDVFTLVKFGSDDAIAGAWQISGADPAKVLIVPEHEDDGFRAGLAPAPDGKLYIGGSALDATGATLLPAAISGMTPGAELTDLEMAAVIMEVTSTELAGVTVADSTGVEDEAGPDDDTVLMQLTL